MVRCIGCSVCGAQLDCGTVAGKASFKGTHIFNQALPGVRRDIDCPQKLERGLLSR